MDVQLKTRTLDGVSILEVAGELDIYTSPKLKAAIQTALTTRTSLVVNLLRTTYLDSTALSVLTTAQKQAREAGVDVHEIAIAQISPDLRYRESGLSL